jgi:hypothetical protein
MYSEQFLKSLGLDTKIWNADSPFLDMSKEDHPDESKKVDISTSDLAINEKTSQGDLQNFGELFDENFGSF